MNLELAKMIKQQRKKKNLTQTDIAQLCQVSHVAISKWESGKAMPDISLLPILARIFQISIDELLNFEQSLTNEEANELASDSLQKFQNHSFQEAFSYAKSLVRMYPNASYLKLKLAGNYLSIIILVQKEELYQDYIAFAKTLCEQIAEDSDAQIAQSACVMLSSMYTTEEAFETALQYVRKSPKLADTTTMEANLLLRLGNGEEAAILLEKSIYTAMHTSQLALLSLLSLKAKTKQEEDMEQIISLMVKNEENYAVPTGCLNQIYHFYAQRKDKEHTLFYLKKYVEQLLNIKQLSQQLYEQFSTVPWFRDIPQGKQKYYPAEQMKAITKQELLEDQMYAFLKEDAQFLEILQRLDQ